MNSQDFDDEFRKARIDHNLDESTRLFCKRYAPDNPIRTAEFHMHLMALFRTHTEVILEPYRKEREIIFKSISVNPILRSDLLKKE